MATDLHIHIDEGLTQNDYHCFFANQIGSHYEKELFYRCAEKPATQGAMCPHHDRIWQMPDILVGETPWPHVNQIAEEEEIDVPDPMGDMEDIFPFNGTLPTILNEETIRRVETALQVPENFMAKYPGLGSKGREDEIVNFLLEYQGLGPFILFH